MKRTDGKRTGEFGLWLTHYLGESDQYSVYSDHGSIQKETNVGVIKGFYGEQVTNKNRLTDIDVMVVNNNNDEAVLLIEIEESEMPPKKVLGDVFATLMCNRFAVRIENEQKYFGVSATTQLIVAGVVSERGDKQYKIRNVILPALRKFTVPDDSVQIDKVKFVMGDDVSETIENLKSEVKNIFAMAGI